MTDVLSDGLSWLGDKMAASAAIIVVYRRGEAAQELPATIGRTIFEQLSASTGLLERFESRDFVIRATDLVVGGAAILPAPGDRIVETAGNTTWTYEVMPLGEGPCWRYDDPARVRVRVHAKQVAA